MCAEADSRYKLKLLLFRSELLYMYMYSMYPVRDLTKYAPMYMVFVDDADKPLKITFIASYFPVNASDPLGGRVGRCTPTMYV